MTRFYPIALINSPPTLSDIIPSAVVSKRTVARLERVSRGKHRSYSLELIHYSSNECDFIESRENDS